MVKIITDTTSVLPRQVAQKYHIPVIPQVIHFDDETYLEGIEIDNATFLRKLKSSRNLPKTSAPPPDLFAQEFAKVQDPNETILCIHPSAEVSGTVRSATVAAQDFPNLDIRIIDTRIVASPLATLVTLAAQWAEEGQSADEIVDHLTKMAKSCRIYFLVDTLEYMAKGGRIGNASALLGSVLQIKPILTFNDGKVDVFEKERTQKRARERLENIIVEQIPKNQEAYLTLMHAGIPDDVALFAERLSQRLSILSIPIYEVPPAIITHAGPGVLGVAFFTYNIQNG